MKYRTIAVTQETYEELKVLAERDLRTITGEVRHLVREATDNG